MATFEIHRPFATGDRGADAEAIVAARSGFSVAAFVLGPIWLAAFRLWSPLAFTVAAGVAISVAEEIGALAPGAAFALGLTIALFIGFEGPSWRSDALALRRRPIVDVIEAANAEDAADMYVLRRLANAAPARTPLRPEPHVLGLFPQGDRS